MNYADIGIDTASLAGALETKLAVARDVAGEALLRGEGRAERTRERVDEPVAGVVARALVALPRIAEAGDEADGGVGGRDGGCRCGSPRRCRGLPRRRARRLQVVSAQAVAVAVAR